MSPSRSITESSYSWLIVMASTGQTCEQRPQNRQRPERRMNSPNSRSPSSEGTTCISRQEVGQMRAQRPQATVARGHMPFLFWIFDGHIWTEEPFEGDLEAFDFVEHARSPVRRD